MWSCAGLTFGVAKNATLIAVRALNCMGQASYSDVITVSPSLPLVCNVLPCRNLGRHVCFLHETVTSESLDVMVTSGLFGYLNQSK